MEADWERREEPISLSLEDARKLLGRLSIQVFALDLILEGKANTNYRIETQHGPLLLSLDQGRGDRDDFSYLAPPEVPSPSLRAVGRGFSLYAWMPGVTLELALLHGSDLPYEKIARDLAGSRLAMNGARCAYAGFFDTDEFHIYIDFTGPHEDPFVVKDPWPSAVEGLLGWLRRLLPATRLPKGLKERITKTIDDAEPRLQAVAGPPVLVHGDFKPSNLLVDETGLTAVLDWEFAHAGTWLSDVGQLLRHPESLPDGFAEAFLAELNAPEDTMLLARTLDLVNLVDFLHLERDQPKLRADVTHRVEEVCEAYRLRFG